MADHILITTTQHIFIDHSNSSTPPQNVAAQARRFQAAEKRRKQRLGARTGANYAKSLVGWRRASTNGSSEQQTMRDSHSGQLYLSPQASARTLPKAQQSLYDTISSGLRLDPFNAFPGDNSKEVMFMVDYHIHVWSPHKAGNFDELMGYNTQLDLCWPIALQDDMLFDATLAVSRAALVLHDDLPPDRDRKVLHHQVLAMNRMRQRVILPAAVADVALIFAMSRMLSLSYMAGDAEAFKMHFQAFKQLASKYISEDPDNEISKVIQNRLNSWQALHNYRYRSPVLTFSQISLDYSGENSTVVALNQVAELCLSLTTASQHALDPAGLQMLACDFGVCQHNLTQLLADSKLTQKELRHAIALIAFCEWRQESLLLQIKHQYQGIRPTQGQQWWCGAAQTYINLTSDSSFVFTPVLSWSSLVLGCFLLQKEQRLKRKGHIILVELMLKLEDPSWHSLEMLIRDEVSGFWNDDLAKEWKASWERTVKRHGEWRELGLWKLGMPKNHSAVKASSLTHSNLVQDAQTGDLVEYLLLRDARDSLPFIS